MIRRRRSPRETPFGLDSFLDLVTNVVGIIIRLIVVAWFAARAYDHLPELLRRPEPAAGTAAPDEDPLQEELARQRQHLGDAEGRLHALLARLDGLGKVQQSLQEELLAVAGRRSDQEKVAAQLERGNSPQQSLAQVLVSLDELKKRRQQLADDITNLENTPPPKVLRYPVPVSKPVVSAEAHFECQRGRVAFVPIEAMLDQVKRGLRDKAELLRGQWQVSEVTEPVGGFRMRYVVGRQQTGLESIFSPSAPDSHADFTYGVNEWQVEPLDPARGESSETALAAGSEFRRLIDRLAVERSAVTFWVYSDSFALYRQLRDHAVAKGLTVAGRPLPDGTPIAGSPWGRKSRGQ